ncbi:chain-length determining protein [Bacteroides pyogenes]|uniref:chain-length determining protein n=1 Tax=Bacteroides pyogenes TaxID=310300 RepID=UPI002FD9B698
MKTYLVVFFVAATLSTLLILPIPRYYTSIISLAPEMDEGHNNSKISSIASAIGADFVNGLTPNALQPSIYPDLIKSNQFIVSLLGIRIKTKDGKVNTSYYDYQLRYQKKSPYKKLLIGIASFFRSEDEENGKQPLNPFMLSKKQDEIFRDIKNSIECDIDIKTGLITIAVTDQDPLVAATMSDSVRVKLQNFITHYKTTKAKNDVNYYAKLAADAKRKYEKARQLYSSYADANQEVTLMSLRSKTEDLENDMQLKFNAYSSIITQLQNAQAKVQEHTPSFTIVQGASVPIKPAGPKRMAFVFIITFLSFFTTLTIKNWYLFFPQKI